MPKRRLTDTHGNHWEGHGNTVWPIKLGTSCKAFSFGATSSLNVYSYHRPTGNSPTTAPIVTLLASATCDALPHPITVTLDISPDCADALAASLQAAAKRAREVAVALAAKAKTKGIAA